MYFYDALKQLMNLSSCRIRRNIWDEDKYLVYRGRKDRYTLYLIKGKKYTDCNQDIPITTEDMLSDDWLCYYNSQSKLVLPDSVFRIHNLDIRDLILIQKDDTPKIVEPVKENNENNEIELNYNDIGEFIRTERLRREMTQTALSEETNVSQAGITHIEKRTNVEIVRKATRCILEFFGYTISFNDIKNRKLFLRNGGQ